MVRRASVGALLIALCVLALDAAPRPLRSGSPAIPITTPARSRSAISATSGSPTRTAPASLRHDRQSRARDLSALLAGRQVDRVLLEPLRQQRRLRRARHRRRAAAADVPHRQRRSRRLDARFAAGAVPRRARRRRVPRRRDALPDPGRAAARRSRCRWTGATTAATRRTASSSSFNRHPAVWTRQHYRGSYAADLWIADSPRKTYTQAAARRALQPLLADVGRRRRDLLRRRSAAERQDVKPGSPEVRKSANNIYKIPANGGPAGAGDAAHATAACSGRRCRATAR